MLLELHKLVDPEYFTTYYHLMAIAILSSFLLQSLTSQGYCYFFVILQHLTSQEKTLQISCLMCLMKFMQALVYFPLQLNQLSLQHAYLDHYSDYHPHHQDHYFRFHRYSYWNPFLLGYYSLFEESKFGLILISFIYQNFKLL